MDTINGKTQIFGILGYPVSHSYSPQLHNAAFNNRKINAVYVPFEVNKADAALKKSISTLSIKGLSVTIPHKSWAAKMADKKDRLSECCNASNTLICQKDDSISAYNTDGSGAIRALKQFIPNLRRKRFLIIGYGGSAAAIAFQILLTEKPSLIAITGRNANKCRNFAKQLINGCETKTSIFATNLMDLDPEDIDVIIHTTPLGMTGQDQTLPIRDDFILPFHHVFDIVYNPSKTPLLKHAMDKKATTIPGYLMLLYQAVLQFELFTGQKAPEHLMEKKLLNILRYQS